MTKKTKNIQYYEAMGRRKKSVARVRLYLPGKEKSVVVNGNKIREGQIYINDQPFEKVFVLSYERELAIKPLAITENKERFCVSIVVKGGGRNGQVEAIVHGISKALDIVDRDTYRPLLKKQGFLRRDPRKKERRKIGTGGKARRLKQSPKR